MHHARDYHPGDDVDVLLIVMSCSLQSATSSCTAQVSTTQQHSPDTTPTLSRISRLHLEGRGALLLLRARDRPALEFSTLALPLFQSCLPCQPRASKGPTCWPASTGMISGVGGIKEWSGTGVSGRCSCRTRQDNKDTIRLHLGIGLRRFPHCFGLSAPPAWAGRFTLHAPATFDRLRGYGSTCTRVLRGFGIQSGCRLLFCPGWS